MIENEPDPLRRIKVATPAEIRAEIGETLRAAREKRGVSVETAAQQTRIPKRFLEALEENRFDEFPAFVYMRGFLKSYCDYLEAPFDPLWTAIQSTTAGAALPEARVAVPAAVSPAPTVHAAPRATAQATLSDDDDPADLHSAARAAAHAPAPAAATEIHHDGNRSSATGALVFAALAALALGIWMFNDRKPAESGRPAETTPRALMPLPKAVEPKVALTALDDSWVRATVDGAVVFEGRLPKGAAMDWRPARFVSLRTSSPASLVLTLNGAAQPMTHPSADGEYRIDVP